MNPDCQHPNKTHWIMCGDDDSPLDEVEVREVSSAPGVGLRLK